MGDDGIFLVQGGELVVLRQEQYETEAILQEALANFPDVLAGGTTVDGDRSKLLLVRREMGVPKAEDAPATWSIDHLFLDRHGVPVLVEVKRSTDTRIRREVVGQMLDYAANGVRYWPVAALRAAVDQEAEKQGRPADELIHAAFPNADPEIFWREVGDNLAAGRIRMVFVADSLPPELIRIIEFLNEQMQPAEVLGVEVVQYVADGHQVYVPRLVGRTSAAVATKQSAEGTPWTRDTFLEKVDEAFGPTMVTLYKQLFEHCDRHGSHLNFGKGQSPGVSAWYPVAGGPPMPTWISQTGTAYKDPKPTFAFYFSGLRDRLGLPRFDEWIEVVRKIEPYGQPLEEAIAVAFDGKWPNLHLLDVHQNPAAGHALLEAMTAAVGQGAAT